MVTSSESLYALPLPNSPLRLVSLSAYFQPKVVEALNKAGAGKLCRKALVHMFGTTTPPPKLNCEEDEDTDSEKKEKRAVKRALAPEFRGALDRVNCRDVSLRFLIFLRNRN